MAVAYSVSSVTAKDDAPSATFVVKRTGTTSELDASTSVAFSTADVSAKAGTDYVATSGSLQFAAKSTEQSVAVGILETAYDSTAILSFLFSLTGFGAATGSIAPSTSGKNKQFYLYIPEDDTLTTVPTSNSPGSNLQHQANYSDFADPTDGNKQLDRPLAYLRLGYARTDMNYYERIILNTETYHPKWREGDADPIEPGSLVEHVLPRGVDRSIQDKTTAMEKNAHLDGVLIYSDKNYNLTVAGMAHSVVQGDFIHSVEGTGRLNWKDRKSEWIYDGGRNAFRVANGITTIGSQTAQFALTAVRSLKVNADQQVNYSMGAKFDASASAALTITNAAAYEVANSIKLTVKGAQIGAECDITGNFEVRYPTGKVASTRSMVDTVATQEINLSIQAGIAKAWTVAVASAASANALAAAAVTTAVAPVFEPDSEFYTLASPTSLTTTYNAAVGSALPSTCAALAAITAGILVAATVAQAIAAEAPDPMPKIEMTPGSLVLSVGPLSSIEITAAGINIVAPIFDVDATGAVGLNSGAAITLDSTASMSVNAPQTTFSGNVTMQNLVCVDISANAVLADSLETL